MLGAAWPAELLLMLASAGHDCDGCAGMVPAGLCCSVLIAAGAVSALRVAVLRLPQLEDCNVLSMTPDRSAVLTFKETTPAPAGISGCPDAVELATEPAACCAEVPSKLPAGVLRALDPPELLQLIPSNNIVAL